MRLFNKLGILMEIQDPVLDSIYFGQATGPFYGDNYYMNDDFILPFQDKIIIQFFGNSGSEYLVQFGKNIQFEFNTQSNLVLTKDVISDRKLEVRIYEDGYFRGGFTANFVLYGTFLYVIANVFFTIGNELNQVEESRFLMDNINFTNMLTTVFGKPYSFPQISKWPDSTYREILMQLINDSLKNPGTRKLLITLIQALGFVAYLDNIMNMRLWYLGRNWVNDNYWEIEPSHVV